MMLHCSYSSFLHAALASTSMWQKGRALSACHAPREPCKMQNESSNESSGTQDDGDDVGSRPAESPGDFTSQPSCRESHETAAPRQQHLVGQSGLSVMNMFWTSSLSRGDAEVNHVITCCSR